MTRPLVLLSNDDGYRSQGIQTLAAQLERFFDVVTCAPDNEQSASSHSLSLNRPLRLEQHASTVFSVDGTPADSVYLALHAKNLLPRRPDLVVSGLNHGLNLGQDVFYSGTVAAAREGALQGFPSLAVSAHDNADIEAAAADAARIAEKLWRQEAGKPCLFNVNYPATGSWAHHPTCAGRRVYSGGLVERRDPRGRPYYWIGGDSVVHEQIEASDTRAYDQGHVGITPLILDLWSSALAARATALCDELAATTR